MDMIYAWIKPQWHNRFIIGLGRMTDDDREPSKRVNFGRKAVGLVFDFAMFPINVRMNSTKGFS